MDRLGVIEFHGFKDVYNQFIIKELAMGSAYCEKHCEHWVFHPPYSKYDLHPKVLIANNWRTRNVHGLYWEQGDVDYVYLQNIIREFAGQYQRIATKGSEKQKWLSMLLGRPVIDLDAVLLVRLQKLAHVHVKCNYHMGGPSACALENLKKLQRWFRIVNDILIGDRVEEDIVNIFY